MILSRVAIKRGITFTMIYLISIGFGLFGLSTLKLDLYPDITFPVIGIITQYEGVGPEDIENSITRPMEKSVVSVENLKRITSRSSAGTSVLILEFDWGTDMDQAEIDVRKLIDFVRDYFPAEATEPLTFAFDPSMQPILFMAVRSDKLGLAEMRRVVADQIEPRLDRINGVASANSIGGLERQIRVLVNPRKLAAQGVSIQQILSTLQMENLQIPGGLVDDEYKEYVVRTYGEYKSMSQIENTVVGMKMGTPIYLKNVAQVIDGYKEQKQVVRNNGQNAVMLYIMKQSDANTVQTVKKIRKELPFISAKVGQGIEFDTIFDQSMFITRSVNNLRNTAVQAFIIAFLVLLFFLRKFRGRTTMSYSKQARSQHALLIELLVKIATTGEVLTLL